MQTSTNSSPTSYRYEHRMRGGDSLWRLTFAGILIMAGLIWLADSMGLLPQLGGAQAKDWIFLGAGGLLLLESLLRIFTPEGHGPSLWRLIAAVVLLGLGISSVFGVAWSMSWWPVILIVVGLSSLGRGFRRQGCC